MTGSAFANTSTTHSFGVTSCLEVSLAASTPSVDKVYSIDSLGYQHHTTHNRTYSGKERKLLEMWMRLSLDLKDQYFEVDSEFKILQ